MTRRRHLVAPTAAAVLILVAGCTGSSDDPKPSPSASKTVEAGASPCELVPAETFAKVNPRDREPRAALMTGRMDFVGCLIGDTYDFSFGYRALAGEQTLQDHVGPNATKTDGMGDEAYIDKTEIGGQVMAMTVGARFGDNEILVRNDSLGNSDPAVRVDEKTTLSFVKELGKNLPDGLKAATNPIELGEGCLPADSKEVKALVGSVVLARGGTIENDTNCDYLGEGGSTIVASRSGATNATDFLGNSQTSDPADLDGVVEAEINAPTDGYSVELTIQPTKDEIAFVNASRGIDTPDDTAERKVSKKDTLAFAKAFLDGTS